MISAGSDLTGVLVEPLNIGFVRFLLKKDCLNERGLGTGSLTLDLDNSLSASIYLSFKSALLAHFKYLPFGHYSIL